MFDMGRHHSFFGGPIPSEFEEAKALIRVKYFSIWGTTIFPDFLDLLKSQERG